MIFLCESLSICPVHDCECGLEVQLVDLLMEAEALEKQDVAPGVGQMSVTATRFATSS